MNRSRGLAANWRESACGRKIIHALEPREVRWMAAVVKALGELPPFTRQFFVLLLTLTGPAVRELPTFCRVGAEFLSEINPASGCAIVKHHRE
jgi:hypothetical protein